MKMVIVCMLLTLHLGAQETIGKVVAAEGGFKAIDAAQEERILSKSSSIYIGDSLITDAKGKGQVLFLDGTMVNLISETRYSVEDYTENRFIAYLHKGGMEFLTGSISKENPDGVEIGTPNAVIGFRGTMGKARIVGGELFVGCTSGELDLTNTAGSLQIGPNSGTKYASIPSMTTMPAALTKPPTQLNAQVFAVPKGGVSIEEYQKIQPSISAPVHNGVCKKTSKG